MSRTKRFISGVSLGYASQVLTTMVGLLLTPFLLHRIGQHDYGLWLVSTQIMFYLGLLDLGIVALLPRETAFAIGRARSIENALDLPLIVGQTTRIVWTQMPLVAAAAIIAWLLMPAEWEGLRHPIGVVLLAFVLTFPLRIFNAVLHGLQDLAFLGRLGIISYLLSTAATVLLVLEGWGLYSLAAGWTVLQLVGAAAGWYRLRTHFPGVLPDRLPKLSWSTASGRLKQGFWVSLNQIAQVLMNATDILVVGKLLGPAAVVPYVCTGKLISVLSNQPQILMSAAGPALSEMRVGESRERLSQVCITLSQAMFLLSGAVVCVVLAVNQGFVGRWVGTNQYGGFWLTVLILVCMLLRHWNLTIGYALFSFGLERRLCVTALADGLVTVGGMALFVWMYGLKGAPLGMIAGVSLISLPANLAALAKESQMSVWSLVQPLVPWALRCAALTVIASALARVWVPNTLWHIALTASAVGLSYATLMFSLVLREPLATYVRPRIFSVGRWLVRVLRLSNLKKVGT